MLPTLVRLVVFVCLLGPSVSANAQVVAPAMDAKADSAGGPHGRHVPLRVSVAGDSARKDLTLYVDRGLNPMLGPDGGLGAGGYRPLCYAPCEFLLRNGTYTFAVAYGDTSKSLEPGKLLKVRPQLQVQHGDQLVLRHRSRLAVRITGYALLLATIAGSSVGAAKFEQNEVGGPKYPGRLAGGAVAAAFAVVGSILLAVWPDRVTGRVQR